MKIYILDNDHSCKIEIKDHAYGQEAITKSIPATKNEVTILLDQDKSHGWYDFSIHVKGNETYSRSFAGRIENGEESFSDPQLDEGMTMIMTFRSKWNNR